MGFEDPNRPPPPGWGQPPAGPPPGGAAFGHPPASPPPPDRSTSERETVILLLGLGSLFVVFIGCSACGPLCLVSLGLSIPAMVMARRDLTAIDEGRLHPAGRGTLQAGIAIAIGSTVLSAVLGLLCLIMMVLYGGFIGALILAGA